MNEPIKSVAHIISWQFIAWILGLILTASTTYQYATVQMQTQFSSTRERLSVIESRYNEIDRRLSRIEIMLQNIVSQQQK